MRHLYLGPVYKEGGLPWQKRVNSSWLARDNRTLVYKQIFTGRVTLQPGTTYARLHSKGLETIRKLTRVGGLTLTKVFTREKVTPLSG